jgi:hypothetical protein
MSSDPFDSKTARQRMPPLAPLTGNLVAIAKVFTTSKRLMSSSSIKIYRRQAGIKRI